MTLPEAVSTMGCEVYLQPGSLLGLSCRDIRRICLLPAAIAYGFAWVATVDLLSVAVPCYGFTPIGLHGSNSRGRRTHSVITRGFQYGFTSHSASMTRWMLAGQVDARHWRSDELFVCGLMVTLPTKPFKQHLHPWLHRDATRCRAQGFWTLLQGTRGFLSIRHSTRVHHTNGACSAWLRTALYAGPWQNLRVFSAAGSQWCPLLAFVRSQESAWWTLAHLILCRKVGLV